MGGSESERAAAEATRDAFESVGARNARLEEFPIQGWTRGTSEIHADESGRAYDCFALPRSPAGSATGPLVDLGYGVPSDFEETDVEGKVVMVTSNIPDDYPRWVHRREKYTLAVENGAEAFLFRNHIPGCQPRSGSLRAKDGSAIGEIPGVSVSYETGDRLLRQVGDNPVTTDVDAEIHEATSQNVRAELGPDTDERIIVSSHIDGHDISESAGDNAVGSGVVMQIAETLAMYEEELETKVEVVGFGAEELGLLGSDHYARKEDVSSIKAVIQNDGVARARNMVFATNGFDELGSLAEDAADRFDHPASVLSELFLSSDNWRFAERGVPAYLVASEHPDGTPAYGSSNTNVLTPADTLDKLDPRDLREHAIVETALVLALARQQTTVPHRSTDDIQAQLKAEDKAYKAALSEQTEVGR
jgi:Zn-dependent M28 family amino/carboxypeptidase